jgi:hypothetical protein
MQIDTCVIGLRPGSPGRISLATERYDVGNQSGERLVWGHGAGGRADPLRIALRGPGRAAHRQLDRNEAYSTSFGAPRGTDRQTSASSAVAAATT